MMAIPIAWKQFLLVGGMLIATVISQECISGNFDAITRTSDACTYAFTGDFVLKLNQDGTAIVDGYPKAICEVFPGLPSNIDAAIDWPLNDKTYFFKGDQYWRSSGTQLDSGYPLSIASNWPGLPNNIDAGLIWGVNGKAYFFKGNNYWRYDPKADKTDPGYPIYTADGWSGYNSGSVGASFQWSNGKTYLFKGEDYWRYNDKADKVESGYPLKTSKEWLGCPCAVGPFTSIEETSCVPFTCVRPADVTCISGQIDAITRTSDGNTYVFKKNLVAKLNSAGTQIEPEYPQSICSVFPGLPANIEAAVHWSSNDKTYFFKGDKYWRSSGTSVDSGYPLSIADYWPGLPTDLDAALIWAPNNKAYFFKGNQYWRYDQGTDSTDSGYPLSVASGWSGYNEDKVDGAFQWSNGKTYLFNGEDYWRYNDNDDRVDYGYPLKTSKEWFGCPNNVGPFVALGDVCDRQYC